ncbi:Ger(x)C family spore germination C-terminal domain-containing protein [Paenibacillus sp. PL91]|uniref:Ger(x)C family spore germination C-terminal domain-containing protein n=1 Tax=Paenibacillus sp. PL91 TaxID=2729538 RepID=UPI00145D05CC|nr:Ger(x)C family spore germination C-terminal domain-containing protein [Paenibacillus sp. PL91]MBC9203994.1 hypothetical protein [Paenibacillus sp. PL91]
MLMAEGVEPVAPSLKINGDGTLRISDIVVFNGFKLAGVLDGEESKGLARITSLNIQEMSSVSLTATDTGASVSAIFRLRDNKSKIKIKAGEEVPEVFIKT